MSLTPLLSGVGLAAGAVFTGAAQAVSNGFSFTAELARQAVTPPDAQTESIAATEKTAAEARDEQLKQFRQRLEERLKALGISLAQPVVLEANPSGTLRVMNDHPQWRAIEQALGDDTSFADQFAQLQTAVASTGVDERTARDMSLELSADGLRVILPR
jgi:hypothetical protein